MEGATHIGVWGVDMAVDSEYFYQRPSCEFALGAAFGLGIKLYIPAEADLLKTTHLYGFEEQLNDEWMSKLSKMNKSMAGRQNKATNEMADAKSVIDRSEGSMRTLKFLNDLIAQNVPPDQMKIKSEEAEKGVVQQMNDAKAKYDQAYSAQQQYIGAIMAEKEIKKIWGTIQ
jgi:hypothetical protein